MRTSILSSTYNCKKFSSFLSHSQHSLKSLLEYYLFDYVPSLLYQQNFKTKILNDFLWIFSTYTCNVRESSVSSEYQSSDPQKEVVVRTQHEVDPTPVIPTNLVFL